MQTYVSLLRGINVSGTKKVPMSDLTDVYSSLGFTDITTYIQSGNVIFRSEKNPDGLSEMIEHAIYAKFGFDVPVLIRTKDEWQEIISLNPFINDPDVDPEKLHVTLLSDFPKPELVQKLESFASPPDKFVLTEKSIFLYCPGGYGITKLSNTFFENKLKVKATTRNWKSVNKIYGLMDAI